MTGANRVAHPRLHGRVVTECVDRFFSNTTSAATSVTPPRRSRAQARHFRRGLAASNIPCFQLAHLLRSQIRDCLHDLGRSAPRRIPPGDAGDPLASITEINSSRRLAWLCTRSAILIRAMEVDFTKSSTRSAAHLAASGTSPLKQFNPAGRTGTRSRAASAIGRHHG